MGQVFSDLGLCGGGGGNNNATALDARAANLRRRLLHIQADFVKAVAKDTRQRCSPQLQRFFVNTLISGSDLADCWLVLDSAARVTGTRWWKERIVARCEATAGHGDQETRDKSPEELLKKAEKHVPILCVKSPTDDVEPGEGLPMAPGELPSGMELTDELRLLIQWLTVSNDNRLTAPTDFLSHFEGIAGDVSGFQKAYDATYIRRLGEYPLQIEHGHKSFLTTFFRLHRIIAEADEAGDRTVMGWGDKMEFRELAKPGNGGLRSCRMRDLVGGLITLTLTLTL